MNVEFQRLEKVEIGGLFGAPLTKLVRVCFEDFINLFKVFVDGHFDPLDTESNVSEKNTDMIPFLKTLENVPHFSCSSILHQIRPTHTGCMLILKSV